jgi:hypothetical protein
LLAKTVRYTHKDRAFIFQAGKQTAETAYISIAGGLEQARGKKMDG